MMYLPVVALVAGFANAYLAFQLNSLLFGLVPLGAFVFGYFASRKTGLLSVSCSLWVTRHSLPW